MPDITHDLKLVFPITYRDVERPDPNDEKKTITVSEPVLKAYHVPISTDVFEANYRVIAAAKLMIFGKGAAFAQENGVRIATLAYKDASRQDAAEYQIDDTSASFLQELKRLTTILCPTAHGYEFKPVDMAVRDKMIDEEDWKELESALVFFTCGYAMARKAKRQVMGDALASVLEGEMTFSSLTDLNGSLPTSMPDETFTLPDMSSVPS